MIFRIAGAGALVLGLMSTSSAADLPEPVAVWPAGPIEVRLVFAGPIDPKTIGELTGSQIHFTEPSTVPDAREGTLTIAATRLIDDNKTLVLLTDPHPRAAQYRLKTKSFELKYDLAGVEVFWTTPANDVGFVGWWPTVDIGENLTKLAAKSADHMRGLKAIQAEGSLSLRAFLDLPQGKSRLTLESTRPFQATLGSASEEAKDSAGVYSATLPAEGFGDPTELSITLKTGPGARELSFVSSIEVAGVKQPIKASQYSLPWVPIPPSASETEQIQLVLEGGDIQRGETVFYSEEAKCANCHKVGAKGKEIGPDLSNIGTREKAWIYRNILAPSASIHPEYVSYTVARKSGEIAMGVVKADGPANLKVLDTNAMVSLIPRDDVEELRPSATSIMPVGLLGAIGDDKTRDLIAYLSSLKTK